MTIEQLRAAARGKAKMVADLVSEFGIPADVALQIVNQEMHTGGSTPKTYGLNEQSPAKPAPPPLRDVPDKGL